MFLTSVYIVIVLIFLFIFIFISRRRNLKLLIGNLLSLLSVIILVLIPSTSSFLKDIALFVGEDLSFIFTARIMDKELLYKFMYVNVLFLIYVNNFIGFYLLSKIFIRNKSYFRDFDNKVLKVNMKVTFAVINTTIVLFVTAIALTNANYYFQIENGLLNNLFSLAERVIARL